MIAYILSWLGLPCLLSAQTLQHEWSFNENGGTTAYDSIAGANITLLGGTSLGGGVLTLPGGAGNYAQFPNGILSTNNSITIETWLTDNGGQTWARAWSFGGSTTGPNNNFIQNNYIDLIPHSGPGPFWTEFNHNGNVDAESVAQLPTGVEEYTVVTYDAPSQTIRLYLNGVQVAMATDVTITPASLGFTYNNFIGLDQWNDPIFNGTFDEMRIWSGAVSQRYLSGSAVAGAGTVINNLTPTSVSVAAGPSVVMSGTEQAVATVQLPQTGANNLPATSDATNWTSSNPHVITVNSSGVISAVGLGTATVSGTVAGLSATSGPITVTPQVLLHRYSFVSDASDSIGGADGTIVAPNGGSAATIDNGLILPGNQNGGFGFSGYVSLPSGMLTNTASLTVECWVTQNQGNGWAEIWDFGSNDNENFALIPYPQNNNGNIEVPVNPNNNDIYTASSDNFPNGSEQYVTFTYNNSTLVGNLYTNGVLIATQAYPNSSYCPATIGGTGGTTQNMLGNDVYGDWQFDGTVYEFRIWNGAVSPAYLAASAVAGPSVVVTNVTPQSLSLGLTTTSMIGAGTQQAAITGSFLQAANVTLTAAATNWTSSNPNILTVNSRGLITAVNGGTATVSATVNGVTATSATITVATTAPTITLGPGNLTLAAGETAIFSVQALGGSLSYQWSFGAAPITGATNATLTLTNVVFADAGTYSVMITNSKGSTNVSATLTVSQAILQHRYSFISDASDSVGGANGTNVAPNGGAPATIANGLSLPGNAGGGYGVSGYVSLPTGILTNTTSLTVECWVTQNQQNNWAEIWDFGCNNNQNFALIPYPLNNNNNLEVAFNPNNNDIYTASGDSFPNGAEQYVCLTFNIATLTGDLYTNGNLIATQAYPDSSYCPGSIGGATGTTQNMLGNDVYGDPQFSGTIYEFRIWNGAVAPLYVAVSAAAGPGVVVTNLTPASVVVTVTNSSMIPGESQPATVAGNFVDATRIDVTAGATNWISSNPSVLTVSSSGLVTAVGTGSASISATVNGVTGTTASINVLTSLPVITANPAAANTLLAGATLTASVTAIGTMPITYFWFTNSSTVPISVSALPTLTVPDVQRAASGNTYTCVVSNRYGTAISSPLALTVVAPSQYEQAVLQYQPIAFWPLDETSGTTAYDVVGGNNGSYVGGCTLGQPGPANAFFGATSLAAAFDGASGYVDIPEGPFNITNAITIVAWLDPSGTPGFDGIVGHGDLSWRMSYDAQSQPGANDGNAAGQADAGNSAAITEGAWHQVVYTYNGFVGQANNGALYIDGLLAGNNTIIAPPKGDSLDVWIGGAPDYGAARLLMASVADVSIFAYSFTAAQVTGLYNGNFVSGPNTLSISNSNSGLELDWQVGTLLQAPTLSGPWTTNYAAVPPYSVPVSSGNQFFKLLINP
ncbi:MAG: LamG-like jellyroll fold domain-containing protein [Verrucomicrobiota bacterium]